MAILSEKRVIIGSCAYLFCIVFCLFTIPANSAETEKQNPDAGKIFINADKLVADNEKNTAEFTGSVLVRQGETTISSNRLKIFYAKDANSEASDNSEDLIDRIVAVGDVVITMKEGVAKSKEAEYVTRTKKLVLTGENSRIKSGGSYVTGSKITLFRDTGQITVEGNKKKRVEAVFYSNGKGIE